MATSKVLTISEARTNLSSLIAELREAGVAAEPVFIGAHRRRDAVITSAVSFEELVREAAALRQRLTLTEAMVGMRTSINFAPEYLLADKAMERRPEILADKLGELQAYGGQRSVELGLADDDSTSVTRSILKGKDK